MTGADLRNADLDRAILGGANLRGANLEGAYYLGTTTCCPSYDAETDFTNAWDGAPDSTLFDPKRRAGHSCINLVFANGWDVVRPILTTSGAVLPMGGRT